MAAANVSPRMERTHALTCPVTQFRRAFLQVECHCNRIVHLQAEALAVYSHGITLGDALRRMRCSDCGRGPARVALTMRYPPRPRDTRRELVVWG